LFGLFIVVAIFFLILSILFFLHWKKLDLAHDTAWTTNLDNKTLKEMMLLVCTSSQKHYLFQ
jgi:succinate dehydrogenase hydrophobic anchor subunit